MVEVKQLRTSEDLEAILTLSEAQPVLILKHSTSCPISAAAYRNFQEYLASPETGQDVAHALVRVIEERPVSLALADRVGVQHQSPQMILVRDRKPVWHDSHGRLTTQAMRDAVRSRT